ncbi:MAG: MBL fold metallo-hydrolase, partial [Acidimicrobiales bacterium]|nr:MBL fold metallo-hydrolase [Acidimicrobiales bacterium]
MSDQAQGDSPPYGGRVEWIGDLAVLPVFDGCSREDPTHMFITRADQPAAPGHRTEDWQPYAEDFLDSEGLLEHAVGGFLVRTGDHVVLVDSGVGPGQIGPYGPHNRVIRGGELPERLRELGVDPAEVTDVVLTHLHPDHYGWAAADDAALFPNATFRCHAADWEHFVTIPGDAISPFSAQLLALAGRLETWDADGPLFPGVDTQHAPGHTPGSTVLVLSSGTARGILLGDVVHCPVELIDPEWASLGDV